jgi:hypothetical protein
MDDNGKFTFPEDTDDESNCCSDVGPKRKEVTSGLQRLHKEFSQFVVFTESTSVTLARHVVSMG